MRVSCWTRCDPDPRREDPGRRYAVVGVNHAGCLPQTRRGALHSSHVSAPASEDEVFVSVWEVLSRRIMDRAVHATALCEKIVLGHGELRRQDDRLFAGEVDLGRQRRELQQIASATGLGINLYLGSRRIANGSVPEAGAPPRVGDLAPPQLIEQVARRRSLFSGTVQYNGRAYLSAARPLGTSRGGGVAPVGIVEAYQDQQFLSSVISDLTRQVLSSEHLAVETQTEVLHNASSIIDNVSRRLQLLALNGNILAAQAGVHGRAFRVVCREMSSLGIKARRAAHEVERYAGERPGPQEGAETALPEDEAHGPDEPLEAKPSQVIPS